VTTLEAIKERPILFSGPMVRAILEGRKTQTRRVVKWKPYAAGDVRNYNFSGMSLGFYMSDLPRSGYVLRTRGGSSGCWNDRTKPAHCPYGKPGERLWVRESFLPCKGCGTPCRPSEASYVCFPDGGQVFGDGGVIDGTGKQLDWEGYRFSPSIHMPRWASRITLEIVSTRIERLLAISEADKLAEGGTADQPFGTIWKKINTEPGIRWEDNPWVWVVEFKRINPTTDSNLDSTTC
jgi:hypothetical protein